MKKKNEVVFCCGFCWTKLTVPAELAGKNQVCSLCGNETLVPTESVYVIRDLFLQCLNSIIECFQTNESLADLPFDTNASQLNRSAGFEMGLYLLFRLDFLLSSYQTDKNRRCIHALCLDAIVPKHDDHIHEIVEHREKAYSKVLREQEGKDWASHCKAWHSQLLSYLDHAKDNYEELACEYERIALVPWSKSFIMGLKLSSIEAGMMPVFDQTLCRIFYDKSDITSLTTDDIALRMKKGSKDANESEPEAKD